MAKMTLLELTQDILNDLDSDEVNSLDDTIEAQQVAQIIKTCYYELLSNRNWPHTRKLIQLEAANDITKPNYLKLPEGLKELSLFKYEASTDVTNLTMKDIKFLEPEAFLRYVSARQQTNPNVEAVVDIGGSVLFIHNNLDPSYWTSFDDQYLVTDSYDKAKDDTLKKSKTQAMAYVMPVWERSDSFVPDLPVDAFSLLLEEAKSTAFLSLKQTANQKAEQKAGRQQRWLARKAWQAHGGIKFLDFGRKGRR